MADVETALLAALQGGDVANSLEFAKANGFDHLAVVGVLKSLSADQYVEMTPEDHEGWKLTDEGEECANLGSPEARVFAVVSTDGSDKDEVEKLAGAIAKVGLSQCMQGGKIFREVATITDAVKDQLIGVRGGKFPAKAELDKLKKRKLVSPANYKTYRITKGAQYAPTRSKAAADITMEMMADRSWKTQRFKPCNFDALGQDPGAGRLHPLLKVRAQFREIFLEMGFEEMPTDRVCTDGGESKGPRAG